MTIEKTFDYSFLVPEDTFEEFTRSEQYVAVSIVFVVIFFNYSL